MTRQLMWMGLLATVLITVVMGTNMLRESSRQADAVEDLRVNTVVVGMDLYAINCVVCHGAVGEGLGATPPLNSEGVRSLDYDTILHTIERGRYNTTMAAYSVNEGGILANAEVDALVALILYGNWSSVGERVHELGLTPPEQVVVELSDETLAAVRSLPDGESLANGLTVFAEECAACHGATAEGTTLAPALNSDDLRTRLADVDITRIIEQGVPGTLMAGWGRALTNEDIANLTLLIRRWEELDTAGIEMPVIEAPTIDMSPEVIAQGEQLFSLLCVQCHGVDGYGTPLAPALNNQTFLTETPDTAIQQIVGLGVTGTTMPAWGGRLSEAEIAALTAFLRSWEPTAPAIVDPGTTVQGAGGGPPWRQN